MNLRIVFSSLVALVILALVLYGLSGFINSFFGLKESILGEAWKLLALAVALSFLAGIVYPHLRGIKQGDQLIAVMSSQSPQGILGSIVLATALQDGKKGGKIGIQMMNGVIGEGVITSYGGTLSPATIKITETENRVIIQ